MKIIKKEKIETEIIEDILCNKCGKSCQISPGIYGGLIETTVQGNYYSIHLSDNDSYTFSICEKCIYEYIKTFKIEAKDS